MNNDKLRQAGEKFREAAGLMCEWLSDQFEAITDVFSTMAKAGISTNDALDALLTAHRAASRIREDPEGKSNNWLKMHGYPMRREVAGRHGRRKSNKISENRNSNAPYEHKGEGNRNQHHNSERVERSVPQSNGKDELSSGPGADYLQRSSGHSEPDQGQVRGARPQTGRLGGGQNGSIPRRRYSGGWPSRKR